jgi:hypothetical protein
VASTGRMELCGEPRPIAAGSRERGEHDRDRPQNRPRRADRPDLLLELGDHDCELQRARHSLRVELAGGGQREERLEEVSCSERRAEVLDRMRILIAVVPESVPSVRGNGDRVPLGTPSTSKTSEPEISSAPLSWWGWTCNGSRSSASGLTVSIRSRSSPVSRNVITCPVRGFEICCPCRAIDPPEDNTTDTEAPDTVAFAP